jgi:hypothetical protein
MQRQIIAFFRSSMLKEIDDTLQNDDESRMLDYRMIDTMYGSEWKFVIQKRNWYRTQPDTLHSGATMPFRSWQIPSVKARSVQPLGELRMGRDVVNRNDEQYRNSRQ